MEMMCINLLMHFVNLGSEPSTKGGPLPQDTVLISIHLSSKDLVPGG